MAVISAFSKPIQDRLSGLIYWPHSARGHRFSGLATFGRIPFLMVALFLQSLRQDKSRLLMRDQDCCYGINRLAVLKCRGLQGNHCFCRPLMGGFMRYAAVMVRFAGLLICLVLCRKALSHQKIFRAMLGRSWLMVKSWSYQNREVFLHLTPIPVMVVRPLKL